MAYALIAGRRGQLPPQLPPLFCDVRDVARAHVAALKLARKPASGNIKRYLICGGAFTWKAAVEHLAKAFPDLKPRLASTEKDMPLPGKLSTIDARPAAEDLGIVEYIHWEKTLEDTIKSLLEVEKNWKLKQGVNAPKKAAL